jgi:hypothetical protein
VRAESVRLNLAIRTQITFKTESTGRRAREKIGALPPLNRLVFDLDSFDSKAGASSTRARKIVTHFISQSRRPPLRLVA